MPAEEYAWFMQQDVRRRAILGVDYYEWNEKLELDGAGKVERRMAPDGIVEAVDVAGNGALGLGASVEDGPPDELGFECLEECLHHGVVVAISLAGHGDQDAVPTQLGLIVDRAILAAAVGMVDQTGCGAPHGKRFSECRKSEVPMQAISHRPADDAAGKQVDDNCQIQPTLAGPDVGDVGGPLLVRAAPP